MEAIRQTDTLRATVMEGVFLFELNASKVAGI